MCSHKHVQMDVSAVTACVHEGPKLGWSYEMLSKLPYFPARLETPNNARGFVSRPRNRTAASGLDMNFMLLRVMPTQLRVE